MASVMHYPGTSRRIKSLRLRNGRSGSGRSDHGEDNIPLDLERDPNDILKEILTSVCAKQGVSTGRKLGHLNNLVKLYCSIPDSSVIGIPMEVIMTCLKSTLVSDVKEVRAAGVRVLRYLINDEQTKQIFIDLHLDYLVTKCLDISHFNEVERIQAIRLVRKIAHLKRRRPLGASEPIAPLSLIACIVSVSLDGAEERDRVYRTCLAVLCELALLQPWLVVRCNGVLALLYGILECHMYHRINECLCLSLMHIINHPALRKWHEPVLDMSPTFAPYTELNYRLHADVEDSKLKDELEMRFMASKMAIVSLLRTWSGLLHVCNSKHMIKSFVEALLIPNENVRRGIFSVLCDLFYFNELVWTEDFDLALNAAAPGHFKDNWRISDGFVVAEGKSLLPVRSVSRPDLVDCHLAVILSCFLQADLLEALSRVAISTDPCSSVTATVILGSTLHLASRLLPGGGESSMQWHLPYLLKNISSDTSMDESIRINLTVKRLQEVHLMRNKPPKPHSVYLSQLLSETSCLPLSPNSSSQSGSVLNRHRSSTTNNIDSTTSATFSILKRNRSLNLIRDFSEDHTLAALKNTKVLSTKENQEWDWEALQYLLLSPPSVSFLRGVGADDTVRRFYRRLIYFYLPSSKLFSTLDLSKDGRSTENRKYVLTACYMVRFLACSDEEGQRLLKNLVIDIIESLPKINADASNYSKASGSLAVTCSREYFLILGTLSSHPRGDQMLERCKAYLYFMGLASEETHESLIRLLVSSLHYSEDSPARMVLNKVLTTCNEGGRLYTTSFLRVLLRSNCPGFQHWGTKLLNTQLFDKSNEVAAEALDILHEACDDPIYLRAVVQLRPTLLHLGERGAILVCRFLSEPQGFAYLSHNHYLYRELKRWRTSYNERYVLHVEELLKLSLTTYERPSKEDGFVRRSGNRKTHQSVYLPAHLYGELCRHEAGARLVEKQNIACLLTEELVELIAEDESKPNTLKKEGMKAGKCTSCTLKIKSRLWALAHIGSTIYGLPLLERCGALPVITNLACDSRVSSIRGTCAYCLCAIAQTIPGVEALRELGYQSVLHMVNKADQPNDEHHVTPPEPIVTPRMTRGSILNKSISSSSQWSTASTSPHNYCNSPRGSASNLSTSSDVTSSSSIAASSKKDSRSRVTSRTATSDPGSSFKIKNRSEAKTSQDEGSLHVSPASNALSTSNVSSRSSVFDADTASLNMSSDLDLKSPHQADDDNKPLKIDMNHFNNKKHHVPMSSHRRTKSISGDTDLIYPSPKPKLKSRFLDLFGKKSRSKTLVPSPSPRTHQQEVASSGYVSDQIPYLDTSEQGKVELSETGRVQLPTQKHVVHSSRMLSSTTLTSSSNVSVDTLKTVDVSATHNTSAKNITLKELNAGSTGAHKADVKDSTNDVSSWNTNNSGQSGSVLSSSSLDRPRTQSNIFIRGKFDISGVSDGLDTPEFSDNGVTKRSQSLPDVLDREIDLSESLPRTLTAQKLNSLKAKLHFVSPSQSSDRIEANTKTRQQIDADMQTFASVNHEQDTCSICINETTLNTEANPTPPTSPVVLLEPSKNVELPSGGNITRQGSDVASGHNNPRFRGNTNASHDSGFVMDTTRTAQSTSLNSRDHSSLFRGDDVISADMANSTISELTESTNENHWRISRPKGLAAIRLINERQINRALEKRKSIVETSILDSDVLSAEEQEDIIKCTRYVGIAIPSVLSDLFKPSSKMLPRKSSLSPASLLKDAIEAEDRAEATESLRERKVSTARQAPKFRGLDESTFGVAVTAGIHQPKSGKIQSVVTPFARTPDSLLSEASDLCYIGGQLVDPGSDEYIAIVHDEIIQLVVNLASSVGMKTHETSLLMMKEKRPEVFDSISLYNSIVEIMSEYSFRLTTRRFVQELFQDVRFSEVYHEAQRALQMIT